MLLCLTREISPRFAECELTHASRTPIDVDLARVQHAAYEAALRGAGGRIERILPLPDHPDGVFVEDTVLVLPELAIILRPGASSRRAETETVHVAVARHREVRSIEAPATVDGGDILRVGRSLYVGRSTRTGDDGIEQIKRLTREFGYRVIPVDVRGCLHLKSAATAVAPGTLLVNRQWLGDLPFAGLRLIDVAPGEPAAANALRIGETVIYPSNHAETAAELHRLCVDLVFVDVSEIQKAEGGVTCCCVVIDAD